jgi:hypothetical protein
MDIWRFLFGGRVRALAVIGLPTVAALLAGVLTLMSSPRYQAEASLTLPQLPDLPLQEPVLAPFADHVVGALNNSQLVGTADTQQLAERGTLAVSHEDGSRLIELRIEGTDRARLEGALERYARGVLTSVVGQDVMAAEQRLQIAQDEYDEARAAMDKVVARAGVVDVEFQHDGYAADATDSRADGAADAASGNNQGATEAGIRADEYARQQALLAPLLPAYGRARDALDHAGILRVRAQQAHQDAQARLNTIQNSSLISAGSVQQVPRLEPLVRSVGIAFLACAALVVLTLLVHDTLAASHRRKGRSVRTSSRKESAKV